MRKRFFDYCRYRRIERKIMRSRIVVRDAGYGIDEFLTEEYRRIVLDVVDHHFLVALCKCVADRIKQTYAVLVGYGEAVYHKLHTVVAVTVKFHARCDFHQFAVDTHSQKSFFSKGFK